MGWAVVLFCISCVAAGIVIGQVVMLRRGFRPDNDLGNTTSYVRNPRNSRITEIHEKPNTFNLDDIDDLSYRP